MRRNQQPVTLRVAARELGVTMAWLRREAQAGQIPHLAAGSALLFDVGLVRRLLLERAQRVPNGEGQP